MKIKIEYGKNTYYIESDDNNYIVFEGYRKLKQKDGSYKKNKINSRYYSQLQHAVNAIFEKAIKSSDAKTLSELMTEVRLIKQFIVNSLSAPEA